MKKLILMLSIILICLNAGWGEPLALNEIITSSNTDPAHPGQYLDDDNIATGWQLEAGSTSGWVELQLAEPAVIAGLSLEGLFLDALVKVEYRKNGNWQLFTGGWRQAPASGSLLDLSYDRVVTDSLRLAVAGENLLNFELRELALEGESAAEVYRKVEPLGISDNKPGLTMLVSDGEYAADGDLSTAFRSNYYYYDENAPCELGRWFELVGLLGLLPINASVTLDVDADLRLLKIYFAENAGDTVTVELYKAGNWSTVQSYSQPAAGWQRLVLTPAQGDGVTAVRVGFTIASGSGRTGGIGEVEMWGADRNTGDDVMELGIPVPLSLQTDYYLSFSADAGEALAAELFVEGNYAGSLFIEVNGEQVELPASSLTGGNTLCRGTIPADVLIDGENFLRLVGTGSATMLLSVRLVAATKSDVISIPEPALQDGWTLTPSGLCGSHDYLFSRPQSLEYVRLCGNGGRVEFLVGDVWTPVTLSVPEGTAAPSGTIAGGIRITVPGGANVDEVEILGSPASPDVPAFKILWPDPYVTEDYTYAVVFAEDPVTSLNINGQAAHAAAPYYYLSYAELGIIPGMKHTLEVVASDGQGHSNSRSVELQLPGETDFVIDQTTELIYTSESTVTFTGNNVPAGWSLEINGNQVPVSTGFFSNSVAVTEGYNRIVFELFDSSAVLREVHYRYVLRTNPLGIRITAPEPGLVTNEPAVTVRGILQGWGDYSVTVNGQNAAVEGNTFSYDFSLTPGANSILVVASGTTGESDQDSLEIYYDNTVPVITVTRPADGFYTSTASLRVTGTVTDDNPVTLLINNSPVSLTGNAFSHPLTFSGPGAQEITLVASDSSGNTTVPLVINGLYDNTPPDAFTVTADPAGWTSDNTPQLTFGTTDAQSGIDRYELTIGSGNPFVVTSPYTCPELADNTYPITVTAYNNAGLTTSAATTVYIDTTPPGAPLLFRGKSGNDGITLEWVSEDTDVVEYRLSRTPAWPGGEVVLTDQRYRDSGLTGGDVYSYAIYAVDRAGLLSPVVPGKEIMVGISVADYQAETGSLVEYEDTSLYIEAGSLPEAVQKVKILKVTSEDMEELATYPVIGEIRHFSVEMENDGETEDVSHICFEEDFTAEITYDEEEIPENFPEENLGVYYFDTMWNRWFKVEKAVVDKDANRIFFQTNHFTDFSVQPTVLEDISPQEIEDTGYSPYKSYASHGGVTVSPAGGSVSTEATELVLPGKNGFNFTLKRCYSSAVARGDSPGVGIFASVGLNISSIVSEGPQAILNTVSGAPIDGTLEDQIRKYYQNQGDFGYALGIGWRLNLPYIRGFNDSVAVRTPAGAFYNINQMEMNDYNTVLDVYRELEYKNVEGEEFTFIVRQVRTSLDLNVSFTSVSLDLVPSWQLLWSKMIMKNGTTYTFDAMGRVTDIEDPAGLNHIQIHHHLWGGIDYIEDSLGREIHFEYDWLNEGMIIPRIARIWIENDSDYNRSITYTYTGPMGDWSKVVSLLDTATDTGGRIYDYGYGNEVLIGGGIGMNVNIVSLIGDIICTCLGVPANVVSLLTGEDSVTITGNLKTEWVSPLTSGKGPGIGRTSVSYFKENQSYTELEASDFLFGIESLPTGFEISVTTNQVLRADTLSVYNLADELQRTTTYSYESEYYDHGQFLATEVTEDDGRLKKIYYYAPDVRVRNRYVDYFDRFFDALNVSKDLINKELKWGFNPFMENENIYEVVPRNVKVETYSSGTGTLISTVITGYDSRTTKPDYRKTVQGGMTKEEWYGYDLWGNMNRNKELRIAGGIETEHTTYRRYMYAEPADVQDTWNAPWTGYPYVIPEPEAVMTPPANESFVIPHPVKAPMSRHNLLLGEVTVYSIPAHNGQPGSTGYRRSFNEYNADGFLTKSRTYTGLAGEDEWAETLFTYYPDNHPETITSPTGAVTTYTYDYNTPPGEYTITRTLSGITDADGAAEEDLVTTTVYETVSGWIKKETDPAGRLTEYDYDALGRVTAFRQPYYTDMTEISVAYTMAPVTATITAPGGRYTKFTYDDFTRIVRRERKVTLIPGEDQVSLITSYAYDGWGQVVAVTDPKNNQIEYIYNEDGRLEKVLYPDETPLDDTDNPYHRLVHDYATNRISIYNSDEVLIMEEIRDLDGNLIESIQHAAYAGELTENYTWQTVYDGLGQKIMLTDPLGESVTFSYNPTGNQTCIRLPEVLAKIPGSADPVLLNPVESYVYDKAGNPVEALSPVGNALPGERQDNYKTETAYDELGRPVKVTVFATDAVTGLSEIAETKIYYNNLGEKERMVDAEGHTWYYRYNPMGLLEQEENPLGEIIHNQYDRFGSKTAFTDPRGVTVNGETVTLDETYTTRTQYDELDRLVKTILPDETATTGDNPVEQIFYDESGNKEKVVNPDGVATIRTFTCRNLLETESVLGKDEVTPVLLYTHTYDANDNLTEKTDGKNQVTEYKYDSLKRLRKTIYPDLTEEEITYDALGRQKVLTEGRDNTLTYAYNALGWVESETVTDVLDGGHQYTTVCEYDPNGNKVTLVKPNGITVRYEFDEQNRLTKNIDSRGQETVTAFDLNGNTEIKEDVRNNTWTYIYDDAGRLEDVYINRVSDGIYDYRATYTYDAAGNPSAVDDEANNMVYDVNQLNKVTSATRSFDNAVYTTAYTYTPAGMVASITYPETTTPLEYEYNAKGLLDEVVGYTQPGSFTYDGLLNICGFTLANGAENSYSFDNRNRLDVYSVTTDSATILYQDFGYDASGNIKTISLDSENSALTKYYSYDGKNQLTNNRQPGNFLEENATDGIPSLIESDHDRRTSVSYSSPQNRIFTDSLNKAVEVTFEYAAAVTELRFESAAALGKTDLALYATDAEDEPYGLLEDTEWDFTYAASTATISLNTGGSRQGIKLKFAPSTPENVLERAAGTLELYDPALMDARFRLIKADYARSSIAIDLWTEEAAGAVKKIELIPGKDYQSHRVDDNSLDVYVSLDNSNYDLVDKALYECTKNSEGMLTLLFADIVTAKQVLIQLLHDERTDEFVPVDMAEFLNDLSRTLKVYQAGNWYDESFGYDRNGNRVRRTLKIAGTVTTESLYYKDTEWLITDGEYAYRYDEAGNTITKGNHIIVAGLIYPVASPPAQLYLTGLAELDYADTEILFPKTGEDVILWQYQYDWFNRLTGVSKDGVLIVSYGYDPVGLRTWKIDTATGNRTHYLYEGNNLIYEKDIASDEARSYIYALGKQLARVDGYVDTGGGFIETRRYYQHTDHLGSVRAVTDTAGNKLWEGEFDAFGNLLTESFFDETYSSEQWFAGKRYEAEVELYYFNARWYDAQTGRFICEDPALDGLNWYVYVKNNPLVFIDTTGEVVESPWDTLNVFFGVLNTTLAAKQHDWLGVVIYGVGTIADGILLAIPGAPAGVNVAIKSVSHAANISDGIKDIVTGIQKKDPIAIVCGAIGLLGAAANIKADILQKEILRIENLLNSDTLKVGSLTLTGYVKKVLFDNKNLKKIGELIGYERIAKLISILGVTVDTSDNMRGLIMTPDAPQGPFPVAGPSPTPPPTPCPLPLATPAPTSNDEPEPTPDQTPDQMPPQAPDQMPMYTVWSESYQSSKRENYFTSAE